MPCVNLVHAYNEGVRALFRLRLEIARIEFNVRKSREHGQAMQSLQQGRPSPRGTGMSESAESGAAHALATAMGIAELDQEVKPGLQARVAELQSMLADLRAQIRQCETRCVGPAAVTGVAVGGGEALPVPPLPFPWQGRYPAVCDACSRLAYRLNELPNLYYAERADLQLASAKKTLAELEIRKARAWDISSPGSNKAGAAAALDNWQRQIDEANAAIDRHNRNIEEITRNFTATLELYNECIKQCPPTGQKQACALPGGKPQPIAIGPNSKYGTGADLVNKATDTATGALSGLLGGLTGGAISLGGGGEKKGPELYEDSLTADFNRIHEAGFDLGVRAGFLDDKLFVSQKIFDSPDGNSTFHTTWLDDSQGRRILPTRYYIFELYTDIELKVWWTYDHWTNGVHDYHDEGKWTKSWREDNGRFALIFSGDEGVRNSIWYQSGFRTAVKGVRWVSAQYDTVMPSAFTRTCPVTLVTHLTQPSQTPALSTVPIVGRLFAKPEDKDKKNLVLTVTPSLIRDAQ